MRSEDGRAIGARTRWRQKRLVGGNWPVRSRPVPWGIGKSSGRTRRKPVIPSSKMGVAAEFVRVGPAAIMASAIIGPWHRGCVPMRNTPGDIERPPATLAGRPGALTLCKMGRDAGDDAAAADTDPPRPYPAATCAQPDSGPSYLPVPCPKRRMIRPLRVRHRSEPDHEAIRRRPQAVLGGSAPMP